MKKLMLVVAISTFAFVVNAQTTTLLTKESKKEKAYVYNACKGEKKECCKGKKG